MTTTQEAELHEPETLLVVVNEDRPAQPSRQPADDPPIYRKLLYLMLGLPLGILYLTVVLTGLGLGVGLMPLALLGVPTTIGLWYINRALLRRERNLSNTLLGARIGPIDPVPRPSGGLWQQFRTIAADRYGWKGMVYLLLRFPAGLFTFTVTVTLAVLSLSLTLAPTYMWAGDNRVWLGQWFDSYLWSFALVPIGIIVSVATIYTTNMLANACRQWTTGALSCGSELERGRPLSELVEIQSRSAACRPSSENPGCRYRAPAPDPGSEAGTRPRSTARDRRVAAPAPDARPDQWR